jgi:AbrB family transcriptional regulator, transcriptional pleiotropic regulator of transition state genes
MRVMKALGIVRKLDDLGRVTIPREVLRTFGLDVRDKPSMEIYQQANEVVIEKAKKGKKGMVRKIDELGRIVIPIAIARKLELDRVERTAVEYFLDGEKIILKKYEPGCTFCGKLDDLKSYKGRNVCDCCIKELAK